MRAFFLALAIVATAVSGASAANAPAAPCRTLPNATALDFWVGTWKVTTTDGNVDGHNRIVQVLEGCAIFENWEGTTPNDIGKSLFWYDGRSHRWSQTWLRPDTTNAGGITHAELVTVYPDRSVRFIESTFGPGGKALLQRTLLAPLPNGTVRQFIEQSRDGGITWASVYDAIYTRESDAEFKIGTMAKDDPMPCRAAAAGKALDFWIGDWNVVDAKSGENAGTNKVERVLDGCAVIENWTGSGGDNGNSLFTYSARTSLWDQVWVTSDTVRPGGLKNKYFVAAYLDGAIRFQGNITLDNGAVSMDRTTLTPLPDGRVRQLIEVSKDGGATWTASFDALYVRR